MSYKLKNGKLQVWEHGEISFVLIDKIPDRLKETKTKIFAKGNTGNNHTFKGGKIYLKNIDSYIIGYFHANKTKLYHVQHSPKGCILPDGKYEIRKQNEIINGALKQIVD